jgi:4-amino-4-deoxy-L-arabinose transferase-like glycosyltransferase
MTANPGKPESTLAQLGVVALLLAWSGVLFFAGVGAGDCYRNEGLRALIGAETLRSGDWMVPRLYGEPALTKPPGMYAAIALASLPFGDVTTATARLPSAIAATITLLVIAATFRRCVGGRSGLVAAAILPASMLWLGRVPSAEIDLLELAWVALSLCAFLRALEIAEEEGPGTGLRQALWWQLALLSVAGGFLTKWTAPAFFYLAVVPLLAWRRRLRLLVHLPHLVAVLVATTLCAGWALAVAHRVGWETLWGTVRREALLRLSPADHPRPYPWVELVTFPLLFLAANLPWSACIIPSFSRRFFQSFDERSRRLLQMLHAWTWVNLLFWALVPGHRPRHALPLQPGLAGLAAFVWIAWLRGTLPWRLPRPRPATVLLGLALLWGAANVVYIHAWAPQRDAMRQARATGEHLAALVPSEKTLYLFGLKDEGILFYYARPARRLSAARNLPLTETPVYCLLTEEEWTNWQGPRAQVVLGCHDEQGAQMVLIAVRGGDTRHASCSLK